MAPLKLLLAAPFLLLSPMNGTVSDAWPPERFEGEASVYVHFLSQEGIDRECGKSEPPLVKVACAKRDVFGRAVMFAPTPGRIPDEMFRRIMAHEIGHVLGWSGEHEE